MDPGELSKVFTAHLRKRTINAYTHTKILARNLRRNSSCLLSSNVFFLVLSSSRAVLSAIGFPHLKNRLSSHSRLMASHEQSDFPSLASRDEQSPHSRLVSSHHLTGLLVSRLEWTLLSIYLISDRIFSSHISEHNFALPSSLE